MKFHQRESCVIVGSQQCDRVNILVLCCNNVSENSCAGGPLVAYDAQVGAVQVGLFAGPDGTGGRGGTRDGEGGETAARLHHACAPTLQDEEGCGSLGLQPQQDDEGAAACGAFSPPQLL